jgi:hypothetical protein
MEDRMRKTGFDLASWVITGLTLGGLAASTGLPGGSALAAAGDMLRVTGDGVNVRFGPSADARVKMRVYHDQQVMELQREGEWVRAEIAGSGGQDGWIHGSLLAAPGGDQVAAPSQTEAAPSPVPPPAASRAAAAPATPAVPAPTPAPEAGEARADDSRSAARAAPPATAEPAAIEPAAAPAPRAEEAADLARFRQSVDYLNSRAVAVAGVDLFTTVEPVGGGVVQVAATDAWSTIPPAGQQSYANTLLDRWAAARGAGGPVSVQIVDPEGAVLLERTRP